MELELTESACPQQPMVCDAETGTCESESTGTVVMGNVAEAWPAGMVTVIAPAPVPGPHKQMALNIS